MRGRSSRLSAPSEKQDSLFAKEGPADASPKEGAASNSINLEASYKLS